MSVFPKLFTHCMGKKKHLSNVGDKINMKVCVIKKKAQPRVHVHRKNYPQKLRNKNVL